MPEIGPLNRNIHFAEPLGSGDYIVQSGDSIHSLADEFGLSPDKIWDHANNSELKTNRDNGGVLYPGDKLFLPPKESAPMDKPAEKRHRFRRKGVPAKFRIQLFTDDKPRENLPWILLVDGKQTASGTTGGDGVIETAIPPRARFGLLKLNNDHEDTLELQFGHLDPVDSMTGIQARLVNLGYMHEDPSGTYDAETGAAISLFQQDNELEVTGQPDKAFTDKLEEIHGS